MVPKRVLKKVFEVGEAAGIDWESIRSMLAEQGIDLDACCGDAPGEAEGRRRVKVVCVTPDLKSSVEELGKAQRDQVVMVRVDEETSRSLDAWVESGAVKSRSEAAALFIREGLKVRSSELAQLQDALREVEQARARLRRKAREVFGNHNHGDSEASAEE